MRTSGKIGLAAAAAFGLAYGAYAIGKDSNNSTQSKPLEEAVCEEVDTQAIYDEGRREGYLAGLRAGRREGEVIGEREGREKGFESGEQFGLNTCNDERYNEGLEACDDAKYAEGMIEGEKIGLEEGRRRFLGSGTRFFEWGDVTRWETSRTIGGKAVDYTLSDENDRRGKKIKLSDSRGILETIIWDGTPPIDIDPNTFDPNLPVTNPDGIVDFICKLNDNYGFDCYERNDDFASNQYLFIWADNEAGKITGIFSQYTN